MGKVLMASGEGAVNQTCQKWFAKYRAGYL